MIRHTVIYLFCSLILIGCSVNRNALILTPDIENVGVEQTIFVATTRKKNDLGEYDHERSTQLSFQEVTVSVPPEHTSGSLTYSHNDPDPNRDFVIADIKELTSQNEFSQEFKHAQRAKDWKNREVTIFVHGYNSSHPESIYRATQIAHDVNLPGTMMVYSWPSRNSAFGYAYDLDSMLFARNGLENTIRAVKDAGAKRITLIAHSMGTALTMEMLRQTEFKSPGWAARTLNGVMLVSPDLSVDVFKSQMDSFTNVPQPFAVIVSERDQVLGWSAKLRGTYLSQRLGNIGSAEDLSDYPVQVIDLTAFSNDAETGHFVAASSPSFLKLFNQAERIQSTLPPQRQTLVGNIFPPGQDIQIEKGKFVVVSDP